MNNLPECPLELLRQSSAVRSHVSKKTGLTGGKRATLLIAAFHTLTSIVAVTFMSVRGATSTPTLLLALSGTMVILSNASAGRFRTRMVPDFTGQLGSIAKAVILATTGSFIAWVVFLQAELSFRAFIAVASTLFLSASAADWVSAVAVRSLYRRGLLRSRTVLIGTGRLGKELALELELRPEYGVDVVATIDPLGPGNLAQRFVDSLDSHGADRLVIATHDGEERDTDELVGAVHAAIEMRIPTFVVPNLHEVGLGLDSLSPDRARGYPLIRVQRSAHPAVTMRLKRVVDVVFALLGLLTLSPLLIVIALAIRFTSPGPILFRQPRVGQGGRVFTILKFRSMRSTDNPHAERSSEYRVTPVGRFLRNSSLDELPQLLNIVFGDMSLVGPRPERVAFVKEDLARYGGYGERHRMPMGLTGLAQVAGLRGEETYIEERVKFDNLYINQWSLLLDLQIIIKTIMAVVLHSKYRSHQRELHQAITVLETTSILDLASLDRPDRVESFAQSSSSMHDTCA